MLKSYSYFKTDSARIFAGLYDSGGDAIGDAEGRDVIVDEGTCAYDGALGYLYAIHYCNAGAEPDVFFDDDAPFLDHTLRDDGLVEVVVTVISACYDVCIGSNDAVSADGDVCCCLKGTVDADVCVFTQFNCAVFHTEHCVTAEDDVVADDYPSAGIATSVEDTVVVDDDVVTDLDSMGIAKDNVFAEGYVSSDFFYDGWVEFFSEKKTDCAWQGVQW